MSSIEQSLVTAAPRLLADFVWPIFWQSTLFIVLLFLVEIGLRRRLRAAVRYSLWLLVLFKLLLPPSLALPTGLGWWLRPSRSRPDSAQTTKILVRVQDSSSTEGSVETSSVAPPLMRATLSFPASLVLGSALGSLALFVWMLRRWSEVALTARRAEPASGQFEGLLEATRGLARYQGSVRLGISDKTSSPVVFGFFRPVILLPASLSANLTEPQLRGVLLHELIHLRRRDVWINCAQTLIQIIYWWHPLLWLANAHIRRVREEAVDDAVMCALREEANEYPQTLIEVAKIALSRPLSGLALVGILESRLALRRRIERLVDFQFPRKAGLTLGSVASLIGFGALALPMGQAPLRLAHDVGSALEAEVTIPSGGAMFWAAPGLRSGKSELVFLKEGKPNQAAKEEPSQAAKPGPLEQDEPLARLVQEDFLEAGKPLDLITKARAEQRPPLHSLQPGRLFVYGSDTNLVYVPNAPPTIFSELQRIRLKEISFVKVPLAEVLRRLNDEVSPVFTFKFKPAGASGLSSDANPQGNPGTPADIGHIPITILPSLVDVRLVDVLEAIVRVSNQRIKYSIEKDSVEFSAVTPGAQALYTRITRVDLPTFNSRLAEAVSETTLTGPEATLNALRRLLLSKGVNLQPPETLFFNDREGSLLIHTTLDKLDIFERTIGELNKPQLQLNIKTRFLRLPDSATRELWKAVSAVKGDGKNFSRILTPHQTATVLKSVGAKGQNYLINEASVTTLSGRQCEVECVDLRTIFSNNIPAKIPFGPSIDLTPALLPDAWKVNLRAVASLREFLGYDEVGRFPAQFEEPKGPAQPQGPIPHIELRQLYSNSTVPDGFTLVLCNPVDMKGELVEKPGAPGLHYVVLVTPTVLSPTGQRLHTDAEIEEFAK